MYTYFNIIYVSKFTVTPSSELYHYMLFLICQDLNHGHCSLLWSDYWLTHGNTLTLTSVRLNQKKYIYSLLDGYKRIKLISLLLCKYPLLKYFATSSELVSFWLVAASNLQLLLKLFRTAAPYSKLGTVLRTTYSSLFVIEYENIKYK